MTDEPHTGQHLQGCVSCHEFYRRSTLLHRALHAPEGLTPYQFTKGMAKADALLFWTDAKALGFIRVGTSPRGTRLFALPSYEVPA